MDLKITFRNYLEQENIGNQKLLLAVSGGVDSMVMLDIALECVDSKNLAVFHLDHGVRETSENDAELVQKMCSRMGIRFFGFQLKTLPSKNKENTWREQRQKFALEAQKEFGAIRILTAHHATDLVETMVFRLAKGAGVSGLSPFDVSMKPFWQISKSELENYAQKYKIEFIHDETNDSVDYDRNLIRHKVLPELRKITPNLEKVFVNESQIFGEVGEYLLSMIKEINSPLSIKSFQELRPILQKELLRSIAEKTPSFDEITDCLRWLNNSPAGNSTKKIGGTVLKIEKNKITWK